MCIMFFAVVIKVNDSNTGIKPSSFQLEVSSLPNSDKVAS